MDTTYIAKAIPLADQWVGWYEIEFPDLPGSHAQAKSLADVLREAKDSLASYLDICREQGIPVAPPSSPDALTFAPGELAVPISVDLAAYRRDRDERTIQKTVSLPAWLAEGANRAGLSLSKVLQEALKSRIAH